jgi:hypothetical protein
LILVPKIKTGVKIQINYLGNFTLGIKTKGFQYSGIIFQKKNTVTKIKNMQNYRDQKTI